MDPKTSHALKTVQPAELRREAEDRLRASATHPDGVAPAADARALLHELQVHQIELEMQNEELREAQRLSETYRDRYIDLYDFAPLAYVTVDVDCRIVEINLAGAKLLGRTRSELTGYTFTSHVVDYDQASFRNRVRTCCSENVETTWETSLRGDGCSPIIAQVHGVPWRSFQTDRVYCRIAITDITKLRQIDNTRLFLLQCGTDPKGEDFFRDLARHISENLGMDYVCIDRLEPDSLSAQTVAVYNNSNFDPNTAYALKDTPCGAVVGKHICCFSQGVRGLFPRDTALQDLKAESYVGTTLWDCKGQPIGLIAAIGRQPLKDPQKAEALLNLVSARAASELERREADKTLSASEERLRLALDAAHMGTFEWDMASNQITWSRLHEELWGFAPGQFDGTYDAFEQRVHPNDRASLREAVSRSMANRSNYACEFRVVWPDRTVHWIRGQGKFVFGPDGLPKRMHGVVMDITDRKQAEIALRESEQFLHQGERIARIGGWKVNPRNDSLLWTKGVYDILEAPLEFKPGLEEGLTFYLPEYVPILKMALLATLDHETPFVVEAEFMTMAGKRRWAEVRGLGRVDEVEGSFVVGTFQDITERKQIEAERADELARFFGFAEASQYGMGMANMDGYIVYANPALVRLLGEASTNDCLGKHFPTAYYPPSMTRKLQGEVIPSLMQSGRWHGELELHTAKGRRVPTEENYFIIRDAEGHPLYLACILTDITKRKQAEEELNTHRERLEQLVKWRTTELEEAMRAAQVANRAKSAFLANMSHEIRTPLNAILGFTQLLTRDRNVTREQRDKLDIIMHSGDHLLTLINSVLETAKIEAGQTAVKRTAIDLHAVLDDMRSLFQLRADAKGLQFQIDRAADFPRYVTTDEGKLRQILINLLGNAVKFTTKGGVVLRVRTSFDSQSLLRLIAEVVDTGPGIFVHEIDRLFQPFSQTGAGAHSLSGTGLGLAISREFARLMGGDVTVASRIGEGCIFRLELPVELAEIRAVRSTDKHQTQTHRLKPEQPPCRILIVDDVQTNRDLLVQMLGNSGFEIRQCENGLQAMQDNESWRPDLIFLDMRMPEMGGDEVLRRIRSSGGSPVKIICVTAAAFEEDRRKAMDLGADDFIAKPFLETELFDKLRKHLGVEFLEAEEDTPEYTAPMATAPLTHESLTSLPGDLVQKLRTATMGGDFESLSTLVNEADKFNAEVARGLRELADAFELERILVLLGDDKSA